LEAGTNPCGLFNYIMYLEPLQAFSEVERQITIAQSNQIFADRMSVPGPRQFPKVDLVQLAKTADYGRRKASQMGGQFADSAVGTASPGPAPYIEAPFKQMIH
jgi:hypothetical protein